MYRDALGLVRRDAGVIDGIATRVPGKSGLKGSTSVVAVVGVIHEAHVERRPSTQPRK